MTSGGAGVPKGSGLSVLCSSEASALAAVHRDCFDDETLLGEAWDARAMAEILQMPGTVALIGARGARSDGVVIVRVAADEAEILTIGVAAAARRQGIGTAMLRAAMATAAAAGARRMSLEVAEANTAAIALYRGLGFVEKGYRRGYYKVRSAGISAVSALILVRELAE